MRHLISSPHVYFVRGVIIPVPHFPHRHSGPFLMALAFDKTTALTGERCDLHLTRATRRRVHPAKRTFIFHRPTFQPWWLEERQHLNIVYMRP